MRMSSLQKCFNGEPFCWNQLPEEIFCYKIQPEEGFTQGDTLYKYDLSTEKWFVECGPSGGCREGCLVHAVQQNDPKYMDRVYYNFCNIKDHLEHIAFKKELSEEFKENK